MRMSVLALVGLTAGMLAPPNPAFAEDQLTVTGGGGSFQKVLRKVVFDPFSRASGIKVNEAEYDYGLAKIRAMVETKTVSWDVVYATESGVRQLCAEGTIETLDWKKLGLDPDKFEDANYTECGVPAGGAATIVIYDRDKLSNGPKTIADFFDLKKFPGKRGLYKSPPVEWALIADGVPIKDVYKVLRTPEGVDRAFSKLDTIKKDIIWWTAGAQAPQLLADGQVVMTDSWTTRVYDANKNSGKHFDIMWDAAVLTGNAWVIPKGSSRLDAAYKFLAFAGRPQPQADVANNTASGTGNRDAIALVDPTMLPNLPNAPQHMDRVVLSDSSFWSERGDELRQRFTAWLAK
ncbi:ABC transporter substrate-binding protein [Bradyrhizobium canariense]|uniref:ABC transporter substrate-binding protein n=1 Tax=Bradyrhizobium canariense TaxID=255045 RepID=UPI000A18E6AF|nr:ABC transporter substrate-binding protein [Bradyrhizobium canariense]OSI30604.1 spermidine/putrescine ABC transporter substrate-binding protein [Bradyrhizobium canariense]OSI37327.1 spermidine/putrescine ABC transporter substrate-binding protein [Bradyrhizobium canariense]OSI52046.1 spermidine/putrescine ABC transporter substrate-binding protein [Bradyrhizobium canariense]OSI56350.1 spermidine/putrescine ABC transporter substrate-binding protein [Bradyrhizobium canariense]OSI59421.1 spermid